TTWKSSPKRKSGRGRRRYCGGTGRLRWTSRSERRRSSVGAMKMDPNRRRQGGRGRRLDGSRVPQLPWTEVTNPYSPMELLSADQLEAIHLTSLRILEELGMEVMSQRALAVLEAGGADVDAGART